MKIIDSFNSVIFRKFVKNDYILSVLKWHFRATGLSLWKLYPSRFETIYGENIGESLYAANRGRAAPPPAAQT